jgi:hypothetical protein
VQLRWPTHPQFWVTSLIEERIMPTTTIPIDQVRFIDFTGAEP